MYAVLFDIDGTLIQSGGAGQVAFAETFCEDFGVAELPVGVAFAGRSDRAIAQEIMQRSEIEPSPENWDLFMAGYTRRLGKSLPRCQGEILPGVLELLDQLDNLQHVAIGLLTGNIAAGARAKLGHYGIADRFAFGGYGDAWADRNDIAADSLRLAGLHVTHPYRELSGAMVVGDTVHDVVCAQSIGAYAVAVATGGASAEELAGATPDLLLEDLTNTETLLDEVMAAVDRGKNKATFR